MISRNILLALRVFRKHAGYSLINVLGLAIGVAAFALISLFVRDELSYDQHHKDADRIYRVSFIGQPPSGSVDLFAVVSSPVGQTIRDEVAGVESVARFTSTDAKIFKDGTYFFDDRKWYAEPELLDIFTMPLVDGAPDDQLVRPETMVISESMAEKYFAGESAVGKTLTLNDSLNYEVTGVFEDIPEASHLEGDMFISWSTYEQLNEGEEDGWLHLGVYTYIKLVPDVDFDALDERISGLVHEKIGEELDQFNFKAELDLEPVTDIYLKSKVSAQIKAGGDMTQVWVFSAVAAFILLLAGINFTNLATARSMERAREVGVRKSIGSSRSRLIAQFLGESTVLSCVALLLGLGIAAASLDLLNHIAGKELSQAMLFQPQTLGILVLAALVTGLLGALYPAVLLSGFNPVDVLKGSNHSTKSGALVRKGLVATQFAISIGLISATIIVMNQLSFMQEQDLGFDKEQVLVVETQLIPRNDLQPRVESLLTEFEGLSMIREAAFSQVVPGTGLGRVLFRTEELADDDIRSAAMANVGLDYFDIYDIPVVAGRSFSRDYPADLDDAMMINENLAHSVGWSDPEDALGKVFPMGGAGRRVVGVVQDYHHSSLKTEIQAHDFSCLASG